MTLVHSGQEASIPTEQAAKVAGHTPGEWSHDEDEIFAKTESGFVFVAETRPLPGDMGPGMSPQEVANARLIAAAPDFFASAQSLLEAWDARTTGAQQIITGKSDRDLQKQAADAMEGLRAAIARATGAKP